MAGEKKVKAVGVAPSPPPSIGGFVNVADQYGTVWKVDAAENPELFQLLISQQPEEGAYRRLPFKEIIRHLGWGWWEIRHRLEGKYGRLKERPPCQCDPPGSGEGCNHHCLDIAQLWKEPTETLEVALTAAAGWLSYYLEQLGRVESPLAAIDEGLRLYRIRKMLEIRKSSEERLIKDHLEALALNESQLLRDGARQQIEWTSEAALLKRLVESWQTRYASVSRQVSMRLGEAAATRTN